MHTILFSVLFLTVIHFQWCLESNLIKQVRPFCCKVRRDRLGLVPADEVMIDRLDPCVLFASIWLPVRLFCKAVCDIACLYLSSCFSDQITYMLIFNYVWSMWVDVASLWPVNVWRAVQQKDVWTLFSGCKMPPFWILTLSGNCSAANCVQLSSSWIVHPPISLFLSPLCHLTDVYHCSHAKKTSRCKI